MAKTAERIVEKKANKFQWFLYTGLIPLLFLVVVMLIVFSVAGVNVFEKAKEYSQKVPFLSEMIKEEPTQTMEELEANTIELEGQIQDKEAQIEKLQSELEGKDSEIERTNLEIEQLQLQIDELLAIQDENKRAFKDIVKTYETMSAKKAAPIISKMQEQEALQILSSIKSDNLAAIMENLQPEEAAKYTELLTNE
ncbi:MotE family protein [Robertmurraya massiliosenegalensis]|uniref:MotE family protein n=1 Tax=Robertmurraya massiliosenegalensis TaxID=1287657 RepID=UPI0002DA1EE0|nr:hypothetical protein [Robertmurraya massiliosenegalensis]